MRPVEAAPLRLDVGRSRLAWGLLCALGFGCALSAMLSDLPAAVAGLVAAGALGWAGALAWRGWRLGAQALVIGAPARGAAATPVHVDGQLLQWVDTAWRGPLCVLVLQAPGGMQRLVLWPDVTDAATRRELRLRAPRSGQPARTASVAP